MLYLADSFDDFVISRAVRKYVDTWAAETPLRHFYKDCGEGLKVVLMQLICAKLNLPVFPYQRDQMRMRDIVLARHFAKRFAPHAQELLKPEVAKEFNKEYIQAKELREKIMKELRASYNAKANGKYASVYTFLRPPPRFFPLLPEDFSDRA